MALEHTPLTENELSPAVARAVGPAAPGPARMMAARGMLPGAGPTDLAEAVYQLSLDADATIAEAALTSADGLPDNILSAALAEPMDPRVLDFFARRVTGREAPLEAVLLNRAVHDETLIWLSRELQERELEILAGNQQRMLRCPAIIEGIYFNKNARMSTVKRLLELAVRNGISLDNLPQFKEIAASIRGEDQKKAAEPPGDELQEQIEDDELDMAFALALEDGEEDSGALSELEYEGEREAERGTRINDLPIVAKLRLANIGSAGDRSVLIKDSNKLVAMAAIKSPAVSDQEAMRYATNRALSEEVIRYIASRKDWQKSYQIKVALVNNPKCPLASSMRLLQHLRVADLKGLARSKNIPATLAQSAKQLMRKRQ